MEVHASIQDVPLGAVLTCSRAEVPVIWGPNTKLVLAGDIVLNTSQCVSRHLARSKAHLNLYPSNILHRTEVDHWLTLSSSNLDNAADFNSFIQYLNDALAPATYLVAKEVSIADYEVFASLYKNGEWQELVRGKKAPNNVLRWYNMTMMQVEDILSSLPADVKSAIESHHVNKKKQGDTAATKHKKEQGGKFVELPGAEMGQVVVRFPPEASGYLHIGHAKAALLNQYYQQAFKGKLIMRFDDTNPEKEKEDYERVILEDLKLLDIQPDVFTHSSDHFNRMIAMCETLIMEGLAYADDTDAATMKKEREERKESANRNNTVEKNLEMWMEMKMGTQAGQSCCIRAKMDMQSANGCMRDPTIYRCKSEPHVKTGTKYKVYPTYDFACPIVDSVEGVTHALRTTEYHDRDEQYFWFIEKLKLRPVHIYEYSRLNMNNTVLSKRKLTWFVDNGLVDGWDDPRFPTVRGILRRGMTVEGLKDFIIAQGSSRSVVNMEWDKIWAFNKKVIDRIAPRYTALEGDLVPVNLPGVEEIATQAPKHPKDASIGTKCVWQGPKVLIESVDAKELKEGQNATFINWGNIIIKKVHRKDGKVIAVDGEPNLSNTDYKKTLKLTWLAETNSAPCIPVVCVDFDHLINKDVLSKEEDFKNFIGHKTYFDKRLIGDPELKNVKVGDIIQLQRKGFYRCDESYQEVSLSSCKEKPVVLFSIPDGHTKESPSSSKKTGISAKEKAKSAEGKKAEKSPQVESKPMVDESKVIAILNEIQKEGDKVRKLKADKADKNVIMAAVDTLKARKKEFQNVAGMEWKPGMDAKQFVSSAVSQTTAPSCSTDLIALHSRIVEQGNTVRQLKLAKADKGTVKDQVDILLALKEDFKSASNVEWKPDISVEAIVSSAGNAKVDMKTDNSDVEVLHKKIHDQGSKVRQLKADNADKTAVKMEVDVLLSLKKEFKGITDVDWKPDIDISQVVVSAQTALTGVSVGETDPVAIALKNQIDEQGAKVRTLKEGKASKGEVDENVKKLLQQKAEYKKLTGLDLAGGKGKGQSKGKENKKPQEKKETVEPKEDEGTGPRKQTRLGMEALKEENFSEWYSQVITKSEMIEYYNVSGCYILRPWSYGIWDFIKDFFDKEIKKLGVENTYFPIFVSKDALEKEKEHIEDFSPEVAWVTRSGSSEMAEPVAVRPTSETVMYPAYAKWIQSHRDLPLRLNQWNNVVRWEFKQPTPFLRTREFLWQEGHTAFATQEEAVKEVYQILDLYAQVYASLLAVPVVKGKKTDKEKFAGGDFTTTTEAFISASGRGIQGATSHHLGQNFSKMIDIVFEDPETKQKKYVYQNSWGITTRTIGVMVMVHGDNKGLVLPPRVALLQAVIMPVGITAKTTKEEKDKFISACKALEEELRLGDVRVRSDFRDHVTPAWKFNHWELKGVPLRLELGPREVASGQVFAVRRDNGEKKALTRDTVVKNVKDLLEEIHKDMYNRAKADLDSHIVKVHDWKAFTLGLDGGNLLLAPFCCKENCEDAIKKDSACDQITEPGTPSMGAKSLCIPFEQPDSMTGKRCIYPQCQQPPQAYTLFGRSY